MLVSLRLEYSSIVDLPGTGLCLPFLLFTRDATAAARLTLALVRSGHPDRGALLVRNQIKAKISV